MTKIFNFIKVAGAFSTLSFFNVALSSCGNQTIIAEKMMYGNVIALDENDTRAQAVGIKDGKIVYVGSREEARIHINDDTEIINYGDNYIYPGFVDAHSHPAMLGAAISTGCLVTPDMNAEQTLAAFRQYIINNPDKQIYECYGSYASFKNGDPAHHFTYKLMDQKLGDVVGDKLAIIIDYGGHSGCLNGYGVKLLRHDLHVTEEAIQNLGMTDTVELESFDGGPLEISGNISETPAYSFYYSIPKKAEDVKNGILAQQEQVLSPMGYTTLGDCGVQNTDIESVEALSELGAEGKLKFKVRAYYLILETDNITAEDQIKIAIDLARKYNNEYFKIIGIKVFIDGVTEKESCYTTVPYVTPPSEDYDVYHGVFRWGDQWRPIMENAPTVHSLIEEANRNGLSVTAHAYGDCAVKFMLDEYEEARKTVKYDRNSISHCAYILDEDIPRFNDLHVSPIVAPHWAFRTQLGDNHDKHIFGDYDPLHPENRSLQKMYKIKTLIDAGMNHVSFHTDGMCPEGVPFMLYSALNRVDPENADPSKAEYIGPRDANEDVSIAEALKCMTANPSYLLGEEDNIGSIELNKSADFSIYPIDFTDPNTFIQSNYQAAFTDLIATYVNGNLAYNAN